MDNPVLVEVTRGAGVESRHRGAYVVMDADGGIVASAGAISARVFPRSAVKALQALPLVEGGFADRFGLSADEIALCCSSHSGQPHHIAASASMLKKAGRDVGCLECGAHWPVYDKAARALALAGEVPSALHNNCSGKHSGFICLSVGLGEDTRGYVGAGHAVQRATRAAMVEMTGDAHDPATAGIDGCSIPTYAVELKALALGFARFGAGGGKGAGMGPARVRAAERIRASVAAHPEMVSGTGRFDSVLMGALGARAFTKTGAEAVFCGALPELGLGIALKIDDGGTRASEAMMATLIGRSLALDGHQKEVVDRLAAPVLTNWNGIEVGRVRVVG